MTVDADIAHYGFALLHVLTAHPHDPPFTYTVGRAERARPELVVFAPDPVGAGQLLTELSDRPALQAGMELPVESPVRRVRLRSVQRRWLDEYFFRAVDRAWACGRRGVAALQVVWADAAGRLPGEDGRPLVCACCPDLGRADRPYVVPFDGAVCHGLPEDDTPPGANGDDIEVCLPVRRADGPAGRVERVRCRRESGRTVRLLQAPMLADWTTAGALLALADEPDLCGEPLAVEQLKPSPAVHLTWSWHLGALDDDALLRVGETLGRIDGYDGVELSLDGQWLAVAATSRHSERVRSAMRRLVRDGLAAEAVPFSAPVPFDERCACCAGRLPPAGR